jgi:hypothetical protein
MRFRVAEIQRLLMGRRRGGGGEGFMIVTYLARLQQLGSIALLGYRQIYLLLMQVAILGLLALLASVTNSTDGYPTTSL